MAKVTYDDLMDDPLGASRDIATNIARGARRAACAVYNTEPGRFIVAPIGIGPGKLLMDSICPADEPGAANRPTPTPSVNGGQCDTVYKVNLSTARVPRDCSKPDIPEGCPFRVTGPVSNYRVVSNTPPVDDGAGQLIANYTAAYTDGLGNALTGQAVGNYPGDAPSLVLGRVDGLPDDCGDGGDSFPYVDRRNPPPALPPDIIVPDPDGDGPDFTFPIIDFDINNDFNIKPEFNFDLGGIKLKFDLGGVTFNFDGEGSSEPPDPRIDDLDDKLDRNNDNINNSNDKLDDLADHLDDVDRDLDDLKDDLEEIKEKQEECCKEEVRVAVTLTTLPFERQQQWGGNTGPDVYYAGWFTWVVAGKQLQRQPIHFQENVFINYEGIETFNYTFANGAEGIVQRISTPQP